MKVVSKMVQSHCHFFIYNNHSSDVYKPGNKSVQNKQCVEWEGGR